MGIQGMEGKGSKGRRDGRERGRNNALKGEIRENDGLQGRRAQQGESKKKGIERVKHLGGNKGVKQTCTHTHTKQNMEILGNMNK